MPNDGAEYGDGTDRRDRPNNHVSVFPYPGSKGREADWLIEKMPPHDTFVDVFGGSGAVIYNKPPSKNEVYNDINDDLVQFFEVLRDREEELVEWLRCVPYSRSLYEEWVGDYFDGYRPENPVERAGRFFALRYMQQRGRMDCPAGFRARAKWPPSRSFDNARERLNELADRFRQVIIENRDYREVLQHYDHPDVDVLFYLDAPYADNEHYYSVEFDHGEFGEALLGLQNDWMVSYGDLPGEFVAKLIGAVRKQDRELHVLHRSRNHRMCQSATEATEHLVCNFDPTERSQFLEDGEQTTLVAATDGGHRAPCDAVENMDPTPPDSFYDLERRVCPNCRLYFDVGASADKVFCSDACRRRHESGDLIADGGREQHTDEIDRGTLYCGRCGFTSDDEWSFWWHRHSWDCRVRQILTLLPWKHRGSWRYE